MNTVFAHKSLHGLMAILLVTQTGLYATKDNSSKEAGVEYVPHVSISKPTTSPISATEELYKAQSGLAMLVAKFRRLNLGIKDAALGVLGITSVIFIFMNRSARKTVAQTEKNLSAAKQRADSNKDELAQLKKDRAALDEKIKKAGEVEQSIKTVVDGYKTQAEEEKAKLKAEHQKELTDLRTQLDSERRQQVQKVLFQKNEIEHNLQKAQELKEQLEISLSDANSVKQNLEISHKDWAHDKTYLESTRDRIVSQVAAGIGYLEEFQKTRDAKSIKDIEKNLLAMYKDLLSLYDPAAYPQRSNVVAEPNGVQSLTELLEQLRIERDSYENAIKTEQANAISWTTVASYFSPRKQPSEQHRRNMSDILGQIASLKSNQPQNNGTLQASSADLTESVERFSVNTDGTFSKMSDSVAPSSSSQSSATQK